MKYGESFFDIAYLILAIGIGIYLLAKAGGKLQKLMGAAALVLGCGDAFHLVPRVLNYFVEKDFTAALGIGKLITSITMTVFYILMYEIFLHNFKVHVNKSISTAVWGLSAVRIALCLFPQNAWLSNNSPLLWGIVRNIPFAILGLIIVILYFKYRKEDTCFRFVWLYVTLSFLFYIPVVVGADAVPLLGALMLPKTICYVLILLTFLKKKKEIS
ncbi:MAG: hypothetical protein IKE65_08180 [Clostridia bacterium]|nr:hypothetical protein [Clostridia bacterium]